MNDRDIVGVAALRSPVGRNGGSLRDVPSYVLGAHVVREAVRRSGAAHEDLSEVLLGCCRQAGNGTNPARTAARLAGVPEHVPATTVNMACSAGMRALIGGVQLLTAGDGDVVVAGGMESMSTIPFLLLGTRWSGMRASDGHLRDGWLHDSRDPFTNLGTGETTARLVERHGLSRAEQDAVALASHQRAHAALTAGRFADEVVPFEWTDGTHRASLGRDEAIRSDTSLERLAALPLAFGASGSLTAGNSSPLADGAAAVVLTTRAYARSRGMKPLFSVVAHATGAVANERMGEGPTVVMPTALKRARMRASDLDLVEINEAFAAVVLVNQRALALDPERVNVHGGALALGHPVGCSGARVVVTLYHALRARSKELGAATVASAGGVATALVIRCES